MTSADTYGALLEREVPPLADGPLYRLVHDDLSEHWHPVWFAEFAEHAGASRAGLRRRGRPLRPARREAARRASSPSCGSSPAATGSRSRTTPTC